MIYFLQPIGGGPIKIGFTENLDVRWKTLESHYRKPLALLGTMPGGREEEASIHDRFSHLRFGRTEQFRPSDDLMAFIGRSPLVGLDPEAVEAMDHREENDNGSLLRDALIRLGYSEQVVKVGEVAKKTGLSRQRISAIFNSLRIMPSTFERIARALEVDVEELRKPLTSRS